MNGSSQNLPAVARLTRLGTCGAGAMACKFIRNRRHGGLWDHDIRAPGITGILAAVPILPHRVHLPSPGKQLLKFSCVEPCVSITIRQQQGFYSCILCTLLGLFRCKLMKQGGDLIEVEAPARQNTGGGYQGVVLKPDDWHSASLPHNALAFALADTRPSRWLHQWWFAACVV